MSTTWKKWEIAALSGGTAALVVAALFGAPALVNGLRPAAPEPTTTVAASTPRPTPTVTPTLTPTPTVAPVVVPPDEEAAPAGPGPDLCPEGTTSNSSDGYNDLSCMPLECYDAQPIPNPAYPQCDYFYPPDYYR